jgi:hypothetical protein
MPSGTGPLPILSWKTKECLDDLNFLIDNNHMKLLPFFSGAGCIISRENSEWHYMIWKLAVKKEIDNGELFFMMGDLYRKNKNHEKACEYLKKAENLGYSLTKRNKKFLKRCNDF